MNQDDQKIIGTMIKESEDGLRNEIKKSEDGLRAKIKESEEGLREEIKKSEENVKKTLRAEIKGSAESMKKTLREEMKETKDELMREIRYNGVLMERLQDSMQLVLGGYASTHDRLDRTESSLDTNQVERIPALWKVAKDHSKRIKKLEKAGIK